VEQFGFESLRRPALALFPNMCIHAQRSGDIGMPQLRLRDPWMHSHESQMAGMKVPQAVPGETRETHPGQNGVKLAASHVFWVEWSPVLVSEQEPRRDPALPKEAPKLFSENRAN